jgi:hypothetical protein
MGIAYNPTLSTTNLIFCYDEANAKSGTTSELIANRSASIISTTQRDFAQDTSLATTYSSVAQYNSSAPSPGTGFSFSAWIRRTGATTGNWDVILNIDTGGPRYRMLWFGWYFNTTDRVHCSMPYYSGTDTAVYWSVDPFWSNAGLTLVQNQWYNFTATYNNSTRVLSTYINGIFALSGTRPGLGDLNNPNNAPIRMFGCNNTPTGNSQLTAVSIYNRALTPQEIQQNFNATRSRFSI